ncbi:MAG: hypothetical protein KBD00_02505 [Candidatus Peribacteraceae bacterium]|nr:hypothetical protein [Candidatus Peribacteraceae bacterium]
MSLSLLRLELEMPFSTPTEAGDRNIRSMKEIFSSVHAKAVDLLNNVFGDPAYQQKLVDNRKQHWPYV